MDPFTRELTANEYKIPIERRRCYLRLQRGQCWTRGCIEPRMYLRRDRLSDNVVVRPGNTVNPKDRIDCGPTLRAGECN